MKIGTKTIVVGPKLVEMKHVDQNCHFANSCRTKIGICSLLNLQGNIFSKKDAFLDSIIVFVCTSGLWDSCNKNR